MNDSDPVPMRLLVALNALRAFEAVARRLSVKAAAEELNVTPSAVSHQLRGLEERLGVDLLRRAGQRLGLTETGAILASELTAGFLRIAGAVGRVRRDRAVGPLRISLLPTFATHWLSPRLAAYPFDRRGFELQLSTTQAVVDLAAGEADAAVRHGCGSWPGLLADRLFAESVVLLGHGGCAGAGPEALRRRLGTCNLFLSQHRKRDFELWNAALPGGPLAFRGVTVVDSAGLALRAAIDGAGMTLAGYEIAAADIRAGRLADLFGHRVATGKGYYLAYPVALARDSRLRNLRAWLLEQAGGP